MQYHILNGDALYQNFPAEIEGNIIICRECLIDGPISGEALFDFWDTRAAFIEQAYGSQPESYNDKVLPQLQKILDLSPQAVVNLWFGDDLFCLINLCFVLYLLDIAGTREKVFLVKAQRDNWQEFGAMSQSELLKAYENKQQLTIEEFQLILQTWTAFQRQDLKKLKSLSAVKMENFPLFEAVIQAHIDRFPNNGQLGKPQQRLVDIKNHLQTDDFDQIVHTFLVEEGIYGFGDLQVKNMLTDLLKQ